MLTYQECAADAQVSVITIRRWVNGGGPFKLKAVKFGHRTKRVRPTDWEVFKAKRAK